MNELAKFLRKLRIENNEVLINMAKKLSVSSSYLSAVENGKRNFPSEWVEIIGEKYNLDESQLNELKKAVDFSNKNVEINIEKMSDLKKEAALLFARRLEGLSAEETKEFIDRLKSKNKKWV